MNLKSLAKDTALYGLSSIVGRFLNYLLVPVYTYYIAARAEATALSPIFMPIPPCCWPC